jgi:hypothetical protein
LRHGCELQGCCYPWSETQTRHSRSGATAICNDDDDVARNGGGLFPSLRLVTLRRVFKYDSGYPLCFRWPQVAQVSLAAKRYIYGSAQLFNRCRLSFWSQIYSNSNQMCNIQFCEQRMTVRGHLRERHKDNATTPCNPPLHPASQAITFRRYQRLISETTRHLCLCGQALDYMRPFYSVGSAAADAIPIHGTVRSPVEAGHGCFLWAYFADRRIDPSIAASSGYGNKRPAVFD